MRNAISFMIVECTLAPHVLCKIDTFPVATVNVPPEAHEAAIKRFIKEFAAQVKKHKVRVVGGDFGRALWMFGPEMEQQRLTMHLAAWFPWVDSNGQMRCLSDTVGIFVVGPVDQVTPLFPMHVLTSAFADTREGKLGKFMDVEGTVPVFASPRGGAVHGLVLGNFMKCFDERAAMAANSLHSNSERLNSWVKLPRCRQKNMSERVVGQDLFEKGAHVPLLMFIGKYSNRSEGALFRREAERKQRKGKGQPKGEGQQPKGKGQLKPKWGGKGRKGPCTEKAPAIAVEPEEPPKPTRPHESGGAGVDVSDKEESKRNEESNEEEPHKEASSPVSEAVWSAGEAASPGQQPNEAEPEAASQGPKPAAVAPTMVPSTPTSAFDHDRGQKRHAAAQWDQQWYQSIGGSPVEWTCPWCGVWKDNARKLQNHVWSKRGEDRHPEEYEQKKWWYTST